MLSDGNDAFLSALSKCSDESRIPIDVFPVKGDQFADAQSSAVEDLEDRSIPESAISIGFGLVEKS